MKGIAITAFAVLLFFSQGCKKNEVCLTCYPTQSYGYYILDSAITTKLYTGGTTVEIGGDTTSVPPSTASIPYCTEPQGGQNGTVTYGTPPPYKRYFYGTCH